MLLLLRLVATYFAVLLRGARTSPCDSDVGLCASDQSTLLQSIVGTRFRSPDSAAAFHDESDLDRNAFDPGIFQSCKHIFIDVGSNRGTHIRKLFEPEKYPDSPYLKLFDEAFGEPAWRTRHSSETGICAYGFEANPRWTETLLKISDAYAARGWRAKWFVPVFVSDRSNSSETFWLNDKGNESDWGASTMKTSPHATPVEVPNVDLSGFLDMLNRHVGVGFRLMKMDIEGAEFKVLPRLEEKKMLCKSTLNHLTIEWHDEKFFFKDAEQLKQASNFRKYITQTLGRCNTTEVTIIDLLDDESYREDGKPLPEA